jgi:hypothetical protein
MDRQARRAEGWKAGYPRTLSAPISFAPKHRADMAPSSTDREHHLTARGWETGHPPADRIETWLRATRHQSGCSSEYVCRVCQWVNPNVPRADRDNLRAQHRAFMGYSSRWRRRMILLANRCSARCAISPFHAASDAALTACLDPPPPPPRGARHDRNSRADNATRRELAAVLEPTFGNRADAELAASLLVSWLQAECGNLIEQEAAESPANSGTSLRCGWTHN